MVRTAPFYMVSLIAISALGMCTGLYEYKVRVTNLTYMQPFSPILLVAHTEEFQIFQVGTVSSDDLRELAETGDSTAIRQTLGATDNLPFLCGLEFGATALAPGASETFILTVDGDRCEGGALLSMASMLVNTNDAFFGIDSMMLEMEISSMIYASAFDAGTEQNNERCTHIPGPACDDIPGNQMGGPPEGFIHVHRGIRGVGDLSADDYTWINPVAEIFIS